MGVFRGVKIADLQSYQQETLSLCNEAFNFDFIWLMAYINYAPMRIGAEDPWALTELAQAGWGLGGGRSPPSI